jgi:hypothetical protein
MRDSHPDAVETKGRVGTIITRSYAPAARVLAHSLARHHPGLRLVALAVDHEMFPMQDLDEPFDVLTPRDVGLDQRELHQLAAIYDAREMCCALKPRLVQYLLSTGADAAVYLDSDMEVLSPLDDLFELARSHSILLNPQISEPEPQDGLYPGEIDFLGDGVYNFLGVGPGSDVFLQWWTDRLRRHCLFEPPMFGDQRWLDFVPCFFEHAIPRDPGYIVAWYNLGFRNLEPDGDGRYRANGSLVRLFHYSFFDPHQPHVLHDWAPELPHRARIASEHPAVTGLCQRYAEKLMDSGYGEESTIPYAFEGTKGGLPLDVRMRRLYRDALLEEADAHGTALPDPFSATDADWFLQWLRAPGPGPEPVSRYLKRVYDERPDLQAAFPDLGGDDGDRFLEWVRTDGETEPPIPHELMPDP